MRTFYASTAILAVLTAVIVGCSGQSADQKGVQPPPQTASKQAPSSATAGTDEEHTHKPGAHGGILVAIGRDNFHAEAVFEKGGILRLFMLGEDETRVQEVESQTVAAYVKAEGDNDATSVVMRPEPQPGDKQGMTSLFLVHLPKELTGKRLEVTVPSLRIGGERFRLAFQSNSPGGGPEHGMPPKVSDADEQKLFLTPGGKYTAADIKANGNVVASTKFKGLRAEHDAKPNPGDKICPISMTKANPKFSWVIGGKTYEFCCPPCVEEFVARAKEKPDQVMGPESYIKK